MPFGGLGVCHRYVSERLHSLAAKHGQGPSAATRSEVVIEKETNNIIETIEDGLDIKTNRKSLLWRRDLAADLHTVQYLMDFIQRNKTIVLFATDYYIYLQM